MIAHCFHSQASPVARCSQRSITAQPRHWLRAMLPLCTFQQALEGPSELSCSHDNAAGDGRSSLQNIALLQQEVWLLSMVDTVNPWERVRLQAGGEERRHSAAAAPPQDYPVSPLPPRQLGTNTTPRLRLAVATRSITLAGPERRAAANC